MGKVFFDTQVNKTVSLFESKLATNVDLDVSLASAEASAAGTVELRNNRLNDGFGIDGAAVAAESGCDRIADHFDFIVDRILGRLNDQLDATSAGPRGGTDPADVGGVFSIKVSDVVFGTALAATKDFAEAAELRGSAATFGRVSEQGAYSINDALSAMSARKVDDFLL
jgi:hypothetical protein